MPAALSVQSVKKTYSVKQGEVHALRGVSLTIESGEIFGLLGPNGAGKTTLINCILGIVKATSGTVEIFGHNNMSDYVAARKPVGFVYQDIALDNFFPVHRLLHFQRGLYGRPPNPAYVKQLLQELDLWDHRTKQPDQLSGGMRRRLALAQALVHEPELVILDEPTAGIDIELRDKTWDIIRRINQKGTTVLLTTHYIEEAENLCNRIGIIHQGLFKKIAPTQQLIHEMGQRRMTLHTPQAIPDDTLSQLSFPIEQHPGEQGGYRYDILIDRGVETVQTCMDWIKSTGIEIDEVELKPATLEEVFRNMAWGNGQ